MKHNSVINGITLICSVLLLMLACLVFSIRSGEEETPANAAVKPTTEVADEIDSLMSVASETDATASETDSQQACLLPCPWILLSRAFLRSIASAFQPDVSAYVYASCPFSSCQFLLPELPSCHGRSLH